MTRERILAGLQGMTAIAAVAALITVLLLGPRISNVDRHVHEIREVVVSLHVPHGAVVHIHGKGVVLGPPGHSHPGGRSAPA